MEHNPGHNPTLNTTFTTNRHTPLVKDSIFLKFERYEHWDDTSIVDGDQEGVKC